MVGIAAGQVVQPGVYGQGQQQMQALDDEVAAKNFAAAAVRVDRLLASHPADLVATGDHLWDSVRTLCDSKTNGELARRWDEQYEAMAHQALEATLLANDQTPGTYYAIARRFPLGETAGPALAHAAALCAGEGDYPSASAMYLLARERGWTPVEAEGGRVGQILAMTSNGVEQDGQSVAFAAPWYGLNRAAMAFKCFPVVVGNRIFFAGLHQVWAFDRQGNLVWTYVDPAWNGRLDAPLTAAHTLPAIARCAVLSRAAESASEEAMIVVACLPRADGHGDCLQALDARTGKVVWNSQANEGTAGLDLLGDARVAGRFVYAVGIEKAGGAEQGVFVLALDVMTGNILWRTKVGALLATQEAGAYPWNSNASSNLAGGIALAGGQIIVSPSLGIIVALDRFDGEISWLRTYEPDKTRPTSWVRFDNRPVLAGANVVAMPADTQMGFGLDLATGRLLWESNEYERETAIGAHGNDVIAQGKQIIGFAAQSSARQWETPVDEVVRGPVEVRDDGVVARVLGRRLRLNGANGKVIESTRGNDEQSAALKRALDRLPTEVQQAFTGQ